MLQKLSRKFSKAWPSWRHDLERLPSWRRDGEFLSKLSRGVTGKMALQLGRIVARAWPLLRRIPFWCVGFLLIYTVVHEVFTNHWTYYGLMIHYWRETHRAYALQHWGMSVDGYAGPEGYNEEACLVFVVVMYGVRALFLLLRPRGLKFEGVFALIPWVVAFHVPFTYVVLHAIPPFTRGIGGVEEPARLPFLLAQGYIFVGPILWLAFFTHCLLNQHGTGSGLIEVFKEPNPNSARFIEKDELIEAGIINEF